MVKLPHWWIGNLDDDIEEPVASTILRKTRAILDLAFGQRTRMEHAECVARKTERIAFTVQVPPLERHPTQRLLPPIAQVRPLMLRAGLGILFADGIDRTGMQTEFFTAPGRQLIQVEAGKPRTTKAQGILLPVVAVIPDKVHLAGQLVKQPVQRLHTVTEDSNHTVSLYSISLISRRTTASLSAPSTPRPEGRGFSEHI